MGGLDASLVIDYDGDAFDSSNFYRYGDLR
jgi:hypothetical protein